MDEPLEARGNPGVCPCGTAQTEGDVLKCAALKETRPLCADCLHKVAALRAAAANTDFHVGL
jgi:hypothetical protein